MTKKSLRKLVEKNIRKKQKGLVDRRVIRRRIIAVAGREFWALVAAGLKRWYDLADGRITTEKEDYEADRL